MSEQLNCSNGNTSPSPTHLQCQVIQRCPLCGGSGKNPDSDWSISFCLGDTVSCTEAERELEDGTHQEREKGKKDGACQSPSGNNLAFSQMLIKPDTCFSGSYFKTSRYASSRYAQSPGAVNWLLLPWALEQVSPSTCMRLCVSACVCACMFACMPALSTQFCAQSV